MGGYAYVNFQQSADADRALDTMNFDPIKGRPCRIMWSQRDPSLRKSGVGNIYIKNLDKSIDNKALYDTFSAFGNILSCKVAHDEFGVSKGFGFVHFETREAAEEAIAKVNGMMLNDKKVYVGPFMSRKERVDKAGDQPKRFNNVFVKNFAELIDDNEFHEMFAKYGEITSAVIIRDVESKSKGFGFVAFKDHEAASMAVNEMDCKEVKGRKITVCRAQKKAERSNELKMRFEIQKQERINRYQGVNLYIKNLEDTIDDERLRKEFSQYGTITSAKVMRDDKAISKGFGFVCFSSPEEATKAVTDMNGRILVSKPLYVALAQRREETGTACNSVHAACHKLQDARQCCTVTDVSPSCEWILSSIPTTTRPKVCRSAADNASTTKMAACARSNPLKCVTLYAIRHATSAKTSPGRCQRCVPATSWWKRRYDTTKGTSATSQTPSI